MKPTSFDLMVIGTGSAASTIATECRVAGWSVAIIDSRPYGGTCALRGCDPKKVLVGAAEVVAGPVGEPGERAPLVHGDGQRPACESGDEGFRLEAPVVSCCHGEVMQ